MKTKLLSLAFAMVIMGLSIERPLVAQTKENKQDNPRSDESIALDSTMVFFIDGKEVSWPEIKKRMMNGDFVSKLEVVDLHKKPTRAIMLYGERYRNGIGIFKTNEE